MATPRPERKAWRTPLAIALGALLALGLLSVAEWSYQRAVDSLGSLGTRAVARNSIQTVMRRLLDAESAQRGYVLTGRKEYLTPYSEVSSDISNAIDTLRSLYNGDAEVEPLVQEVAVRAIEKLSESSETISLYDAGSHDAWRNLMLTDIGREKMEAVRKAADILLAVEDRRVAAERAAVYRTLELGRRGVTITTLLSLLWFIFFLRKDAALQAVQQASARDLQAERDALDVQVHQRTAELAELNRHLQDVRENERGNLARSLHDELGALLTAAKLDLVRLRRALPEPPAEVSDRINHLASTIDQGIGLKRRVIEELMPSALHNLGLRTALEILAGEFSQRTGLSVQMNMQDTQLDASSRNTVYQLVRESLTNVEQHAAAREVQLNVRVNGSEVEIQVHDDGRGFNRDQTRGAGHVWKNLRHRIEALGGRLSVASAPGRGTEVDAMVPMPATQETPSEAMPEPDLSKSSPAPGSQS